jgi:hypothetical protein
MHQQVRCLIRSSQDDSARGALDEESLVKILSLLKGMNLRSAGRVHGDGGGEFVFSVRHRPHDDTPDQQACDILTGNDYEARVLPVESFDLDDKEGALLAFIQSVEGKKGEPVIEVHIGSAERNGKVPVQLVTQSMLNR